MAKVTTPDTAVAVTVPTRDPPEDTDAVTTVEESPDSTLPFASRTSSLGCVVKATPEAPPDACWVSASTAPVPGVPVAVNVNGEPDRPVAVAVTEFDPAVAPKVQVPAVAIPEASVVAPAPVIEPPPLATAKVTATPDTGFPPASVTRTESAVVTAVPTVADCPLPAFTAMAAAAPGPVGVIAAVVEVRDGAEKVSVVADAVLPVKPSPANVAMPFTATTLVVPDREPLPAATETVSVAVVTVLPLASATRMTGCVASVAPEAPATGAVETRSLVAGPKGVTDADAADAAPVPFAFDAVTVNVCAVPAVRPVTVQDVAVAGLGAQVAPPGDAVAVYDVMADPPLSLGAVQETVTWPCPAIPLTDVGAPGTVWGTPEVDAVAAPEPAAFTARNCTW